MISVSGSTGTLIGTSLKKFSKKVTLGSEAGEILVLPGGRFRDVDEVADGGLEAAHEREQGLVVVLPRPGLELETCLLE